MVGVKGKILDLRTFRYSNFSVKLLPPLGALPGRSQHALFLQRDGELGLYKCDKHGLVVDNRVNYYRAIV